MTLGQLLSRRLTPVKQGQQVDCRRFGGEGRYATTVLYAWLLNVVSGVYYEISCISKSKLPSIEKTYFL
jgi:hypothetical protein